MRHHQGRGACAPGLCLALALALALTLTLMLMLSGGCSDDGSPAAPDSGAGDGQAGRTDARLWPCAEPGQSCNAHDTCAIDPVCGPDNLCRPTAYQDCSDELACTIDTCAGMGLCDNTPSAGSCALPVTVAPDAGAGVADAGADGGAGTGQTVLRCFEDGDRNPTDPCRLCDPSADPLRWSPANGGACDDGNACTRDDYCQAGTCKGTYYGGQCADAHGCTTDLCDGKGGCLGNKLKSDWCLIGGTCVKDGATDSSGCNACDVTQSQSSWTVLADTCAIGGACYKAGATSADGCGVCKPAQNATGWTPVAGKCLIGGTCHDKGDLSPDTCGECKPSVSTTGWTPVAGKCLIGGTCFSDGAVHPGKCATCDVASSATSWTVTDSTKCVVNDVCVDKATSALACGACGVACGPGETCSGGACSCGTQTGTVGGGAVCGAGQSCDAGACVNLPAGVLVAPLALDFELSDGGLSGTKDWEWGTIGAWKPGTSCDSSATPPTAGTSGKGVWGTRINDCHSPLGNASSSCNNASTSDDSVLTLKVKLPGTWSSATLTFYQWYDLFLTFDWTEIRIDGKVAAQTCTGSAPSPPGWTKRTVDLKAHVGKIVTITFHMMATTVVNYSGWYIDDLAISGS